MSYYYEVFIKKCYQNSDLNYTDVCSGSSEEGDTPTTVIEEAKRILEKRAINALSELEETDPVWEYNLLLITRNEETEEETELKFSYEVDLAGEESFDPQKEWGTL